MKKKVLTLPTESSSKTSHLKSKINPNYPLHVIIQLDQKLPPPLHQLALIYFTAMLSPSSNKRKGEASGPHRLHPIRTQGLDICQGDALGKCGKVKHLPLCLVLTVRSGCSWCDGYIVWPERRSAISIWPFSWAKSYDSCIAEQPSGKELELSSC